MTKYINAEKLRARVAITMDMQDLYLPIHFFEILDSMPSANVIPSDEIVHCKNCIYARQNETFPEKYECRFSSTLRKKDDYCSEGETEDDYK